MYIPIRANLLETRFDTNVTTCLCEFCNFYFQQHNLVVDRCNWLEVSLWCRGELGSDTLLRIKRTG